MKTLDRHICCKAAELFMLRGIKSVSMDDISRQLGISKKTLYQSVANKEELVAQVLKETVREKEREIITLREQAENPIHELILLANHVTSLYGQMSAATLHDLRKYYPQPWQWLREQRDQIITEDIRANLVEGIARGLYLPDLDVEIVSELFRELANYITDVKQMQDRSAIRIYPEFVKYHIRGIATQQGRACLDQVVTLLN